MKTIRYHGDKPFVNPLAVPGWSGSDTKNAFQLWHDHPFTEFVKTSFSLPFPFDDTTVSPTNCRAPFSLLSDKFYLLELTTILRTQENTGLLVMQHPSFYDDWLMPLPVASTWQTDWWTKPIQILFRFGPFGESHFQKGKPFAQIIPIERDVCQVIEMTNSEKKHNDKINDVLIKGKYQTREWVTSTGFIQSNLYNVLAGLENRGKLPNGIRPKKSIRRLIK